MTPEDITALVESELRAGWDAADPRANPHGLELARCLLARPERGSYLDSFDGDRPIEMWLVLKEARDGGYLVVYDAARGAFGLAIPGEGEPHFVGYHGSFLETLAGM